MSDPVCAITLHEPWATLMMIGAERDGKGIETRNWYTDYRGPLAIHAGKTLDAEICREEPFLSVLRKHFGTWDFLGRFSLGCILGTVELLHVFPTEEVNKSFILSENESWFGNYGAERFAWVCDYPLALPRPIPARGLQRLWYLSPAQRKEIMEQTPAAALA